MGHDTLAWEAAGAWTYPLPDALGSVRQSVDAAGTLLDAREWSPYGEEIGAAQAGLGFTGEWFDAAVGLQYLRARWYDPAVGRFDPDGTVLEGPEGPVSHLICGGVYDWSTGLLYRGGRYFDPALGIWLALAPLMVVTGGRKRKSRRQGALLLCVALLAVGTLVGCEPPHGTGTATPTICATATAWPTPTAPATSWPTPTSEQPTATPEPPTSIPPTSSPDPKCGRITRESIAQAGGMENYLATESDVCTLARVAMGESHENEYDRTLVMWLIKMRAGLGYQNANRRGLNAAPDRWGAETSIKVESLNPNQFEVIRAAYTVTDPESLPVTGNLRAMLNPPDTMLHTFQNTLQVAANILQEPLSSMPEQLKGYDGFLAYPASGGWTGAKNTEQLAGPPGNFYRDTHWIDNIHFGLVTCEWVRANNGDHPLMDLRCP